MRKSVIPFLLALGAVLAGVSCTREIVPEQIGDEQDILQDSDLITISAKLEPATKTELGPSNVVNWCADDQIRIFNASTPEGVVFTIDNNDAGSTEATFTGPALSGEGPFYAVYPASAATATGFSTSDGDHLSFTFPQVQQYVEGSFGTGANIAVATADELADGMPFKNVGALISFTITGSSSIKSINVYSRGGEQLNGKAGYWPEGSSFLWQEGQSGEPLQKLTLDCGTGVALDNNGKTFYLAVPVPPTGSYFQSGFTVEIIDTDDKAMLKQSGSQTPVRSTILQMTPFAYSKQYNASFLLSEAEAGAFTGVPHASTCSAISCGQYAYLETPAEGNNPGSWYFRFQDWNVGYALSLTTPLALTFGGTLSATVAPLGNVSINASNYAPLKVLKKTGNRIWLVDTAEGNGYIMTLED